MNESRIHVMRRNTKFKTCTFSIPEVKMFIESLLNGGKYIDPFCGESPFASRFITNDINPRMKSTFNHMECLTFLKQFPDNEFDVAVWDAPRTNKEMWETYREAGIEMTKTEASPKFYVERKKELARIVKPGGFVASFGWNSNGMGEKNCCSKEEILVLNHGEGFNDTICVLERKVKTLFDGE
jgi:hypothetical protein